ncbi:hypothetical protein HpNP2_08640 [Helicobacter pylori]
MHYRKLTLRGKKRLKLSIPFKVGKMFATDIVIIFIVFIGVSYIFLERKRMLKKIQNFIRQ